MNVKMAIKHRMRPVSVHVNWVGDWCGGVPPVRLRITGTMMITYWHNLLGRIMRKMVRMWVHMASKIVVGLVIATTMGVMMWPYLVVFVQARPLKCMPMMGVSAVPEVIHVFIRTWTLFSTLAM